MIKQAPSLGRILAMAVFALSCFALLMFLWLAFGGPIPLRPEGYRIQVAFPEAATLAQEADVRISGVNVGKVKSKRLDERGHRTIAELELDEAFAPVPRNTRAILRQKTLLGETYVQLSTGDKSSGMLEDGERLPDAQVEATVELDEIFGAFDEPTRKAFQEWIDGLAQASEGEAPEDLNDAFGNLAPFATDGARLLEVLDEQETAVHQLFRNTGRVFAAINEREGALRQLIVNSNNTFEATASRDEALAETFEIFPTFLDESKATLARLETFAVDTEPLLEDLRPVARDLQPTLRDLRRMAPDLRRFFLSLPALIEASEDGLPALGDVLDALQPTLAALGPWLQQVNPLLQWLEINQGATSDFISIGGWAIGGRRATQNPTGGGHALPQLITTGSQSLIWPERSPDNRGNAYLEPSWPLGIPFKQGYKILPTWDCNNAGGEKFPDDTPGCKVQGPIPFQGKNLRFPHLEEEPPRGGG